MKNIMVTLDFKGAEEVLLAKAVELAQAFKSKIWLVHIAAPDPDFVGYEAGPDYIRDDRAKELRKEHRLLQEYTDTLKGQAIEAEGLLVQGATVETIFEKAKDLQIDLLICGHQEHGFFYNLVQGSVSSEIIKNAKIPVLLIPQD